MKILIVWSPWLVATVSPSGEIATAIVDNTVGTNRFVEIGRIVKKEEWECNWECEIDKKRETYGEHRQRDERIVSQERINKQL